MAIALMAVSACQRTELQREARKAEIIKLECKGNIETFDLTLISANVTYSMFYKIDDLEATIWFADRKFVSEVRSSSERAWRGNWLFVNEGNLYFSFLPEPIGEMRYMFEPNVWFAGRCS